MDEVAWDQHAKGGLVAAKYYHGRWGDASWRPAVLGSPKQTSFPGKHTPEGFGDIHVGSLLPAATN